MPDWLVNVLIQYPIVVVIGFVAWYAYTKVERAYDARVTRDEQYHAPRSPT
ncbi:MAG TPA: hypothetical protein VD866_05730 [Urbifossiella sp.]|nr:hypothetical protein [Urbifossiella sp.]